MKAIRISFFIYIILLFSLFFARIQFNSVPQKTIPASDQSDSADTRIEDRPSIAIDTLINPFGEAALSVLKASDCARCHTGSLSSSLSGALAFFDLEDTPWYSKLPNEHLEGISSRILFNEKFTAEQQEAIRNFVKCQLNPDC